MRETKERKWEHRGDSPRDGGKDRLAKGKILSPSWDPKKRRENAPLRRKRISLNLFRNRIVNKRFPSIGGAKPGGIVAPEISGLRKQKERYP